MHLTSSVILGTHFPPTIVSSNRARSPKSVTNPVMSNTTNQFSARDHWKSLVLYGLNTATYKIALGKTLLGFAQSAQSHVAWDQLSRAFLDQYIARLSVESPMPQLDFQGRLTVMERIVAKYRAQVIDYSEAIAEVGENAFDDVIPRFQRLGRSLEFQGMFYEYQQGSYITLTDSVFEIANENQDELLAELDSRWGLLEGAFKIGSEAYRLNNDLRLIYIQKGYERKNLTDNIPFLQGYQGNTCFYCSEPLKGSGIAVDHVLPRQVVLHDEIWNLVLAHDLCNGQKTDRLVGEHFIQKLIARNENIMGSNHPWKKRIEQALGSTKVQRKRAVKEHYSTVAQILGWNYWGGGPDYSPESDPFFRRLITVLNNGKF